MVIWTSTSMFHLDNIKMIVNIKSLFILPSELNILQSLYQFFFNNT